MLKQSLIMFLLVFVSNSSFCQSFELSDRFKEQLRETAKNEDIYDYMLFSIELNWKKENHLITEEEFQSMRAVEMEKRGLKKPILHDGSSKQNLPHLIESNAAEPFIAMDPSDPSKLVATTINNVANPPYNTPVFYSSDGGSSWNQSNFDPLAAALTTISNPNIVYGAGDPVLTIDKNGTVHMVYLTAHEPAGGGYVLGAFYVYSMDGGQNFIIPPLSDFVVTSGAIFNGDPIDRIWLATDNSGGPNDGTVYLCGFLFSMSTGVVGQAVFVKPPLANAFTQGPYTVVPTNSLSGNVRVDNNGTVHVSCSRNASSGGAEIVYSRSTDQGQTWDIPLVLDSGKHKLDIGEIAQIHSRENCAVSLAVGGNNVYLAWSKLDSNMIQSFYAYSQDGGTNWSGIQEFGPAQVSGPYYHLMPCLAAFGDKCSIAWFVVDSTTLEGAYYQTELLDNGQTFGSSQIISSGNTDFMSTGQGTFYGDYNTITRDSCIIYSTWADGQAFSPTTYVVRTNSCDSTVHLSEYTPLSSEFSIESLYPNPAHNTIIVDISISKETILQVEISDVQGKLIKAQTHSSVIGNQSVNLPIEELSPGTYLLKVKREDGVFISRKFIKN